MKHFVALFVVTLLFVVSQGATLGGQQRAPISLDKALEWLAVGVQGTANSCIDGSRAATLANLPELAADLEGMYNTISSTATGLRNASGLDETAAKEAKLAAIGAIDKWLTFAHQFSIANGTANVEAFTRARQAGSATAQSLGQLLDGLYGDDSNAANSFMRDVAATIRTGEGIGLSVGGYVFSEICGGVAAASATLPNLFR